MKSLLFALAMFSLLFLSSCATGYYQVFKVTPVQQNQVSSDLAFEDANCKVTYNFLATGGDAGFVFHNKTDQNLYLNLGKSFFIRNGFAHNYFRNRVVTVSSSTATGVTQSVLYKSGNLFAVKALSDLSAGGHSVAFAEESVICVPPKSSKILAEYKVSQDRYRDCDLLQYPAGKNSSSKTFSPSESPFVFSNLLTYTVGESGNEVSFDHQFYVSTISNHPQYSMFEYDKEGVCGKLPFRPAKILKLRSPDEFYIEYTKGMDRSKH